MFAFVRRVIEKVRQSSWAALSVKGAALAVCLGVLGLIGSGVLDGLFKIRSASASAGAGIGALGQAEATTPEHPGPAEGTAPSGSTAGSTSTGGASTGGASSTPDAVTTASASGSASARPADCPPSDIIVLNTASVEELQKIPGIGPSKAAKIIELRVKLGGKLSRLEDLYRIRGIKRKLLEKIRPRVRLDPAPGCF